MTNLDMLKEKIKDISEHYTEDSIGGFITGDGPVPSDVLFVGEAPGKTEVSMGKPFVGMAGKTFEEYLHLAGLDRKDVRVTNTCYFRPITKSITKSNKLSIKNRTPKTSEILLFKDILNEEISIVKPKIIITLGNTPLKSFTNFSAIGQCHGKLLMNEALNIHIYPMYHPSALTYNRNPAFEETYRADWMNLGKILKDMNIL